ncbi:beta-lactamase-like protein [Zopfochytrium polystomum]|nr:beta-lactamase-like protein [Zopfochytrium polystomum]
MGVFNSPLGYYIYRWAMLQPSAPPSPSSTAKIDAAKAVEVALDEKNTKPAGESRSHGSDLAPAHVGHHRILLGVNDYKWGPFAVVPVPYSADNYAYLIYDAERDIAAAVDPADPDATLLVLASISPTAKLTAILTTHHHWDHSSGNSDLKRDADLARRNSSARPATAAAPASARWRSVDPDIAIYGSAVDFPAGGWTNWGWHRVDRRVVGGSVVAVGRMRFQVVDAACHTKGSVMYLFDPAASLAAGDVEPETAPSKFSAGKSHPKESTQATKPIHPPVSSLFTGDAIFVGGAGKYFEGTAADMRRVVRTLVAEVPGDGFVWPGHEYALNNLLFARELEPSNIFVQMKYQSVKEHSHLRIASIPSTVADEVQHNPFLRLDGRRGVPALWRSVLERAQAVNDAARAAAAKGSKKSAAAIAVPPIAVGKLERVVAAASAASRRGGGGSGSGGGGGSDGGLDAEEAEVEAYGALRALKDRFKVKGGRAEAADARAVL